jgi:uncharacterized membrane protein YebE (DUF533 family)
MNPFDILGSVMQAGMSRSAGDRMGGVLGQIMGGGAPGGMTGGMPGGMPGGGMPGSGMLDVFSKVAGAVLGGGQGGVPGGAPGGGGISGEILKQVAGAVLGGGSPQGNAAAGAGSMAIFGGLAAQALEMAKSMMGGGQPPAGGVPPIRMDDQTAVIAGMRAPRTPEEHRQVLDMATLTLKAMITAAKADGRVDDQEKARLLGKLQEDGVSSEEQRFVSEEMARPIDIDDLVRRVPNQQAAAQIYAASLMAIELDTDAERRYMSDLASKLGLNSQVVAYLHQAVGVA